MTYILPEDRASYQRAYRRRKRLERELTASTPKRGRPAKNSSTDVKAEDKRSILTVRLPVTMIARLVRLKDEGLATGKYPWRTISAVAESLFMRGFESMAGDPFVDEMLPYLRAMAQIDGIAGHRKDAQAAMSRFKIEIAELLKIGADENATQYFHAVYIEFLGMNPNVWRDWALTEMRRAFPALAKSVPKGTAVRGTDSKQKVKAK